MRQANVARFITIALGISVLLATGATAQVATRLLVEDGPLVGAPAGHIVSSISTSAVNHAAGFSYTVNSSDGVTTLSHVWGTNPVDAGLIRTEGTFGNYQQTSYESFFGIGNSGESCYSAISTDIVGGTTGLDGVWLDDAVVAIEEEPYPHQAGYYWSFGSRPGCTRDGIPYWVGGITPTQGGSTEGRGLFYGMSGTPKLLYGQMVTGLPDPLDDASTVSFDFRFSSLGNHYIAEVQTETGSSTNNNHMVIDGAVIMIDGLPVSESGAIPVGAGGLPGEVWDNFDYCGINEGGSYLFTGDTGGDIATDEFILQNGKIIYREGDVVDGETLSGSIEGAYMNREGDIVYIWDIQGNSLEAIFANDVLLLKEGDPVDIDGDLIPDSEAVIENFTGIASVTLADRGLDGMTRIYFTADYTVPVKAGNAGTDPFASLAEEDLEKMGLRPEDLEPHEDPTRANLEGAFVMLVPTCIPVFLADFDLVATTRDIDISWAVTVDRPGEFRLVASQDDVTWELPYTVSGGRFSATDDLAQAAAGGSVTYTLYHRAEGQSWILLGRRTVDLTTPELATCLVGASPNPFNPQTEISFMVSRPQQVRIELFDASGRMIKQLADEVFQAGTRTVAWDGTDRHGRAVASGTYLAHLEADGVHDTQKLMLVR